MKSIEKPPLETEEKEEGLEREQKYINKEIAEIEPATISLVEQMKGKIEQGEYDALVSDDVGGRIPTLALRKVINSVNPEGHVETLFVASGKLYFPQEGTDDYKKLLVYLTKFKEIKKIDKALLVTQFVFKGGTVAKLLYALKKVGIDADVAILEASFPDEMWSKLPRGANAFIGSRRGHTVHKISEEHEKLSGITKAHPYSPVPIKATKRIISYDDYKELYKKYYGESPTFSKDFRKRTKQAEIDEEYERMEHEPITPEQVKKIQSVREDINLLSKKVVNKVWGEK